MENNIRIIIVLTLLISSTNLSNAKKFNVMKFGAENDGKKDSTKAFLKAWSAACGSTTPAIIIVPHGRYLLGSTRLEGPCNNNAITFQIDGALVAPSDLNSLKEFWIEFYKVEGVSIRGGKLDAQGTSLWDCKASKNEDCPSGATTLGFWNSKDISILGLTSLNSKMFHIVINGCNKVKLQFIKVLAAENSPNTDGIHVQSSSNVKILNSRISTGDDCVSIGPGTYNLLIENVACGHGHGIRVGLMVDDDWELCSIGSLAKDLEEAGVENVIVKRVTFRNTQNGLRIKSWGRPTTGFVNNVIFQHAKMFNVQNPIVIDQNYCPYNKNCPGQVSGVQISDVVYEDIEGTSSTEVAVKFDCSKSKPCKGIKTKHVNLTYNHKTALASCANADGTTSGKIQPSSCF